MYIHVNPTRVDLTMHGAPSTNPCNKWGKAQGRRHLHKVRVPHHATWSQPPWLITLEPQAIDINYLDYHWLSIDCQLTLYCKSWFIRQLMEPSRSADLHGSAGWETQQEWKSKILLKYSGRLLFYLFWLCHNWVSALFLDFSAIFAPHPAAADYLLADTLVSQPNNSINNLLEISGTVILKSSNHFTVQWLI